MRVEIVFESANQRAHIRSSDPRKDESKLSGEQYCGTVKGYSCGSQSLLSIWGMISLAFNKETCHRKLPLATLQGLKFHLQASGADAVPGVSTGQGY